MSNITDSSIYEYYDVNAERAYIKRKMTYEITLIVCVALLICFIPDFLALYKCQYNLKNVFFASYVIIFSIMCISFTVAGLCLKQKGVFIASYAFIVMCFIGVLVIKGILFYNDVAQKDNNWVSTMEVLTGLIGISLGFIIERHHVEKLRIIDKYVAYRTVLLKEVDYILKRYEGTEKGKGFVYDAYTNYKNIFNLDDNGKVKDTSYKNIPNVKKWQHFFGTIQLYTDDAKNLAEYIVNKVKNYEYNDGEKLKNKLDTIYKEEYRGKSLLVKGDIPNDFKKLRFVLQHCWVISLFPIYVDTFDDILDSAESMSIFFNLPRKDKKEKNNSENEKQNNLLGTLLYNIDKNIKYINQSIELISEGKGLYICAVFAFVELFDYLKELKKVFEKSE